MAYQEIQLGDTGQEARDKLDNNFDELYNRVVRELALYSSQEIIVLHIADESITSENLSDDITSIEYSTNGGGSWADPSYPIAVSASDETVWRVKVYNGAAASGMAILNSTLT